MTDDRERGSEPNKDQENNVDNKMDSLLPAPGERSGDSPEQHHVDDKEDVVLPVPGAPDTGVDDASTREEMEVDTTADGIDDFIPLDAPATSERADDSADPTSAPDVKVEPRTKPGRESAQPPGASSCPVCGEDVGDSRFCPECGTEQVPSSRFLAQISPLFMWSRPLAIRVTLSVGALLALIALLADSGAMALLISAWTLPVVILIRMASQLGGWSHDGWIQIGMMMLVGIAVGLPLAWLATRMVRQSWFDGGVVNFGATNFGGTAVQGASHAPFIVWLTSGVLLPLVALLVISAAPATLRVALAQPPQESTGMMLTASVAAGYMVGSATVFYWPLFSVPPPAMSPSEWTLSVLGIGIIRPLVWVYSGAIAGAVVWRYLRESSLPDVAMPGGVAIGLPLLFSLASLAIAPFGLWGAIVIGVVFAVAAVYLQTRVLETTTGRYDSVVNSAI